jgi:hypothetical protein
MYKNIQPPPMQARYIQMRRIQMRGGGGASEEEVGKKLVTAQPPSFFMQMHTPPDLKD